MVNDVALAPLCLTWFRLVFALGRPGIEQQVVDLVLAERVECLLGKGLDGLEIRQLEGQDGQAVLCAVVGDIVVCLLGPGRIPGSEYDLVSLTLGEELLDCFESLCRCYQLLCLLAEGPSAAYQAGGHSGGYDRLCCERHSWYCEGG